jgi:hypothetical protein
MTATQRENAYKKYREKRRDLRKKIKAEKERRWKELCNDSEPEHVGRRVQNRMRET